MNYSVYGCSVFSPCIGVLAFNGQVHDRLSSCYLLGNGVRAFSPTLMRFISPDPYSPFGVGGLHTYAYCGGDPVNYMDIDGNMKFSVLTRGNGPLSQFDDPPAPPRQSVIVTAQRKRASVIVYAGSFQGSEAMDTSGQSHDPSHVVASASSSSSTRNAQVGQIQSISKAKWTNPGFPKEQWDEGVRRYVAFKTAHSHTVSKTDPVHLVAALVINKNKGMPGIPFNSYPAYVSAHMRVRGKSRIKAASDKLAHLTKAVRNFENSGGASRASN
ncbi:RHS repeat-associated core domain-containing protein [Pseudomonas sp. NGC7]|uniref:RHS repeat-associated core domain-containing protein n=1 Tax=Pseudomonas sp. NGC7 TaxID=3341775 RepID=UPI0037DB755A